ncbi:TetR/AcrR family transcriptional regulator [Paenibacillus spongiae]|uniref:TetR/AcrR family transcriptional regulator n=1 Tax=Paenibacillus spongiae TaxID=2909671 RepID=A0ABY5SDZ4_9BACL|nr:TetR/AcrR family transcriptional regulator [Paenibacillus spongiae]UVI30735.1 TetR/AcrR family transcriptional regulator [Paenibacillus spongiae]
MEKGTDRLRLEIMRTAQQLFDEHGVEAVSMHQVAKSAGIGQGTLYRRYPNKSSLCLSLMETKFDRFKQSIVDYLQENADAPAVERLSRIMTSLVEFLNEDLEWVKTVFHCERLEDSRDCLFQIPPFIFFRETIQGLLEEAAAKGDLIALDPMFVSSVMASSIRPELMLYLRDSGYSSAQIAEQTVNTFIKPLFIRSGRG